MFKADQLRGLMLACLATVPFDSTAAPSIRLSGGVVAFPDAGGPWMLLGSADLRHWEFIGQTNAAGLVSAPIIRNVPYRFYKGARLVGVAANTAPVQSPSPASSPQENPWTYYVAFSSFQRWEARGRWQQDEEQWDGGDTATYTFSYSGGDVCPSGGRSSFAYHAPHWRREILSQSGGCEWELWPSLGASFSLWPFQAAITNSLVGDWGTVDQCSVAISHRMGLCVSGVSNKPYIIEIGVQANEWEREPMSREWYPVDWVGPDELLLQGDHCHYVKNGWAIWRFTVVGGQCIDVTIAGKPGRFWSIEYGSERYEP